jgi:hypothetical protein
MTRRYGLFDATIEVATDAPAVLAWLDEFLTPAFEIRREGTADFVVRIIADEGAYEGAAATRPAGPPTLAACFALDREVTRRPSWAASGDVLVEGGKPGVLYRIRGTRVDILVHPASGHLRAPAMRVIRELAVARTLARSDRMQLHAAALETDGLGLLLAGPKGAGKTTLLGYLAASTGARVLANDRVLLDRTRGGVEVRGVPTIVSIRPDSRRLLPCSFDAIPRIERPVYLTVAEADAARVISGGAGEASRLSVSPAQLARQLGVALAARARLAAIAFPGAHPDPEDLAVDRLDAAEAGRRLRDARFGARSGKDGPTIFEQLAGEVRPPHADASLVAVLARAVPCFSVRMGARLFADARAARAVLSACLDA